jgi:nuclear pore complex protein Nup160
MCVSAISHLPVEQLVRVLTSESYFDLALRLCSLFELPKTMVLEYVASKCVAVTRDDTLEDINSKWLSYNFTSDVSGGDGSPSSVAWKYLQKCLKLHEESGRTELHKAIVTKLILVEAFLPQWLIDSYKVGYFVSCLHRLKLVKRIF